MSDAALPPPTDVTLRVALARAFRERCPRCGQGAVFETAFRGRERCDVCDWLLERGPGHWVGGTEVHMILCFFLGLAFSGAAWAATGSLVVGWIVGAALTAALTPLLYRRSRCLFFALDYLIDPMPDEDTGWDGGDRRGRDPRAPEDPAPPPGYLRLPLDSGPPACAPEERAPRTEPEPDPSPPRESPLS
jgi:uncharacterized protein (DUF983 family)